MPFLRVLGVQVRLYEKRNLVRNNTLVSLPQVHGQRLLQDVQVLLLREGLVAVQQPQEHEVIGKTPEQGSETGAPLAGRRA